MIHIKKRRVKDKPGAPSGSDKKNKNPFLKPNGSFDLIEKFPGYENKKKRKKRR